MAGDGTERSLEFTSTWAVVTIISCFVVISLIFERLLHWLGQHLIKTKRKAHYASLVKIKDELMLVGFVSLAMTLLQKPVSKICVPSAWYNTFTPCDIKMRVQKPPVTVAPTTIPTCRAGSEQAVTATGLHQLHIFIFLLAGVHVIYSFLTMALALWKVHSWRKWEKEAQQAAIGDQYLENIANSITYTRKSTFQEYHTSWCCSQNVLVVWVVCFFHQLYIPKADYITLRQGFTRNHHLRDDYDFDAYMIRCMEDEFQKIVGISLKLWVFVLLFILFNVHGVYLYFWTSFIPVILVLVIGAKLQHVVATLAIENAAVPGAFVGQLMQPRDQLFWFGRPELLLSILHLVMFQNAFELATFLWHVWAFGFHTCLLEHNKTMLYIRLLVGLGVQIFVSTCTLPLYALVSQMGTNFKPAVLPTRVGNALHTWHKGAKKRLKMGTLFSFAHKNKNTADGIEQQSLRSQGSDDSSLAPPMQSIMEDSSMGRADPGQRTPRQHGTDLHSVYVQIDKRGRNERDHH
ncbi:hypothetical protein M758_1G119500 [Ceratodon purpureus]|nr:hypothetical protein M758_1G119500 [Ceratodon purpureus]